MDEQGQEKCKIIQVAIPSPAHGLFDYRLKPGCNVAAGQRVQVPFGKRTMVAVIIAQATSTDVPREKLRNALNLIDQKPVLPKEVLNLLLWASRYYHFPIGLVISNALPALLRKGKPARLQESEVYRVNEHVSSADSLTGAPVQQKILELLIERRGQSVGVDRLRLLSKNWGSSIQTLVKKGLVTCETVSDTPSNVASHQSLPLTDEQAHAVDTVTQNLEVFQPFLLQGVTGSGKTEVYLHCVNAVIKSGRQCLVIVPEISLTPQLMLRFEQRISGCLVSLHSALNDTERMQNWLCAANGIADVVIGTRSSVFTPLPRLGLIIIDEEHDVSLKQQEGFRYHARDLAMVRARNNQCRVLLGSATPSFETLHNVALKKIECLQLTQRAGGASAPRLSLLDIRRRPLTEGLSDRLLVQIQTHLSRGLQVLVFVNQRGYAPTLLCNDCGTPTQCQRCDAHLTVHLNAGKLRCHHCGAERPIPSVCYACGSERLERMGYGTQRIADALQASFPDYSLVRIDRDSTRRKGAMEAHLSKANSGEASILVGTQMLAKGHTLEKA